MRLYLVRHGRTAWNTEQRAQGHADIELDSLGEQQAQGVAEALRKIKAGHIVASDLKRCVATANPIAEAMGLTLETTAILRERSFGELEGEHYQTLRDWTDAQANLQNTDPFHVKAPGGESMADVWSRLETWTTAIKQSDTPTVIVSHGGALGIMTAQLVAGNLASARSFRFHNASITEFRRRKDGYWEMERYDDIRHLEGLRP